MKNEDKKYLCPNCKTGQETYLLDSRSSFCPYIRFHNGNECSRFRPIRKESEGKEDE